MKGYIVQHRFIEIKDIIAKKEPVSKVLPYFFKPMKPIPVDLGERQKQGK